MLQNLPILLERPIWLFLLLLIVPCFLLARRSIGGLSRTKAMVTFIVRSLVIILLTIALAEPVWEKRGEGLTVTILLDRSLSIPLPLKTSSLRFLDEAVKAKENPDDRVAVITIAKDANIAAMPDKYSAITTGTDEGDLTATNLASGLELAMAIMPDDTANRILLASDGNETIGSVLTAADIAIANKVPVDVLLLEYEHDNEVIFERIVAPARAREGQSANIKMVLRSQNNATGTVTLKMNGVPIDLNGNEPGDGMRVEVKPGPATVLPVTVSMDTLGPKRFEAVFEPDNVTDDQIHRNNTAIGVTFVGGEGKVLILDEGTQSDHLVRALTESDINVEVQNPSILAEGPVFLSGYDAVVLADVPRFAVDDEQDRMLHAYVHDLGGGLVMLGGPHSFGAGGWISSELKKALPVKLDPPQTRQMLRGALALIMHSCEMPQGNFWGEKVAITAIEGLSSLDYVGLVEYNWNTGGTSWAFPMQEVGDKSAAIAAAKKMIIGDMPDFQSSMKLAYDGLMSVRAGQRHAIIISDGDPSGPTNQLMQSYINDKVTITTVMVGGHGTAEDQLKMNGIAGATGGRFYNVTNPKKLPEIFFKESQIVSRSLIQEGELYQPQVVSRLPGPIEGFAEVPPVSGYVLTAQRDGLAQMPVAHVTGDGIDPIYAHWNFGLGKSIAFTSDLTGRWGSHWAAWDRFRAFWEQSIRWVMRPGSPANFIVNTRTEGDIAVVDVEALEADASFLNFMQTRAVVLRPDQSADPLELQQIGPGRYRGEFKTGNAGAYLVNINYAAGSGEDSLRGNLQAAVTVPYSSEFRSISHNASLLTELAKRTGGRIIAATDPTLIDMFNAQDLEVPKSPRDMWDLLAIIAAALFVFDVAARRISIDPKWLAAMAGRAVGKRADTSAETVAAWKRARSQVAHRKPKDKESLQAARRDVRFEANEESRKQAIDVGKADDRDRKKPNTPVAPKKADQKEPDEGDYTSRLLAAKRRARGEDKSGGESK